ncbi:hypothetical protein BTM25_21100 [Actinomadura rubteroloni]|uniref:Uncharacterized protein n=1 Tax=Actinomadura rubteroloni TaxID=1926885 RepID=A0A2P4URL1_9ACTN|nr:hypothetical protein [Actinomadura rubteroloni]POM27691.1 hypothetical protein BTM25_21100 [Actinomadura rubteroloni]
MAPESLAGFPTPVLVLWIVAATGWGAVLAGLRAGLPGRTRGPAVFAHVLTAPAALLAPALVGFGALPLTVGVAAAWWALALTTGFRPQRLVAAGGWGRLALFLVVAVPGAVAGTHLVL